MDVRAGLSLQQQFRIARARARRLLARTFDESKHPRDEDGKWTEIGSGGSEGGYGLVPGDAEKFKQLKSKWATVNNELLAHVDEPDGPESQAKIDQLEVIVKEIQNLRADPGGVAGIGLPGGPRDVTIVGAGPGGLAASINGAAEGLDTLVIEANVIAGGQAKFSSRIENFPGFPIGITGERLTQNMFAQAQRLGAETKLGVRVTGMTYDESTGLKHLTLSNGETIQSRTVIMAGGLEFVRIPFPGSEGSGVIVGDGKALAKAAAGGPVVVVGGSNGAAQAVLGVAQTASHVYLLARSPVAGSMSAYQIEALRNHPKVTVIESDSIAKLWRNEHGDPERIETVKGQSLPVKAVGIFVGSVPDTKWVPVAITTAKGGRIPTNADLETPLPGVYAVGDMRDGAIGRVGVAVGEGQLALRQANVFLIKQQEAAKPKEKAAKPKKIKEKGVSDDTTSDLFDLDRADPWFGQTAEGVTPLPTPDRSNKKQWQLARAQAQRLLARGYPEFNPDQPRDEGGRFGSGGGGASEKPKGGPKKKVTKEDFKKAKIELAAQDTRSENDFVDGWNSKIGEDPAEFKKEFMGGLDGTMTLGGSGRGFDIKGSINAADGSQAGTFSRYLDPDGKEATSSYFSLKKEQTHSDIGKKMLAGNIETYQRLGIEKVVVSANIDVGGYAWAKYGYVPTQSSWNTLRNTLERKLGGGEIVRPGGDNTTRADSWDMLSSDRQDNVRDEWMRRTHDEFLRSEEDNWRESGQALEDTKRQMVDAIQNTTSASAGNFDWVDKAFTAVREARKESEQPDIPYTDAQLVNAMEVGDYESNSGDGSDDPDISFNDLKLREPIGHDAGADQPTLPGIEPEDLSKRLTKEMREDLIDRLVHEFNAEADDESYRSEPPDYLSDSIGEQQESYWDDYDDAAKLDLAADYGMADIELPSDEEDQPEQQLPLEKPEADPLLAATRNADPKSIWKVADSARGKELLLGTNWHGVLNLKDTESMARFKAYVSKKKNG